MILRDKRFWVLLMAGLAMGFLSIRLNERMEGILAIQELVAGEESAEGNIGGNDWVEWKDGPSGVYVARVHPLIKNNPFLKGNYIEEGDTLISIEYEPFYQAEAVERIMENAKPGSILSIQVRRGNPLSFAPVQESFLLVISYAPRFTFPRSPNLWFLSPWVLALGVFLSLLSVLILFPILRPDFRQNWPVFGVLFLAFLIFAGLLLHHVNLLVRNEFVQINGEQFFIAGMSALMILYGVASLYSRLKGWLRLWVIPSLVVGGLLWTRLTDVLFAGPFYRLDELLLGSVLLFMLFHISLSLILSMMEKFRHRSPMDKAFHVLSLVFSLVLVSVYALNLLGPEEKTPGPLALFLAIGAVYIPLLNSAASQIKFGRVSLVLGRSLQYLVFALISLGLFLIIHQVFGWLKVSFRYQGFLEVSILIVLVILLRSVYKSYERPLRQYFILSQEKKKETINRFISLIPQYTSSGKLLEDLYESLGEYFQTAQVGIKIEGEQEFGMEKGPEAVLLEKVYQELNQKEEFWSQTKQLHSYSLPQDLESDLADSPFSLAFPIRVNEKVFGLLLLGKKKRGVYNLDDLEIISRTLQQTRLTLGVLYLLEREKLLMQRTYEANLTALRSQINPHFLFNTLNTISALIHDDPDDAEVAVEKLAFIFRYTLKKSSDNFVSLKDEMSLIRTYLDIEKIRFGDRLELNYAVDPKMEEVLLPAFVMQTIVENCIKHGVAKIIGKGIVSIEVKEASASEKGSGDVPEEGGRFMLVTITDNGPGIDLTKINTSTGLNNITTRLEQIYELKNLLYFENTGNGTRVTIKIPLDYEQI